MRFYWDSSALVAAALDDAVRDRLAGVEAVTRTHSFAEVFSTLTGSRLGFRIDANDAARIIHELATELEMIELSRDVVLEALGEARTRGVRGGQVHDYLHAVAARKAECTILLTLSGSDFEGLFDDLPIEAP